jgi:flavin-dependent dehydrogenase
MRCLKNKEQIVGANFESLIEEVEDSRERSELKEYQLRIDEHLFGRIERQLARIRLAEGKRPSKQAWIEKAIKNKLHKNRGSKILNPKRKYRSIKLLLDFEVSEKLEKQLGTLKTIMRGYSKKTWILDAIEDALLEEEHLIDESFL